MRSQFHLLRLPLPLSLPFSRSLLAYKTHGMQFIWLDKNSSRFFGSLFYAFRHFMCMSMLVFALRVAAEEAHPLSIYCLMMLQGNTQQQHMCACVCEWQILILSIWQTDNDGKQTLKLFLKQEKRSRKTESGNEGGCKRAWCISAFCFLPLSSAAALAPFPFRLLPLPHGSKWQATLPFRLLSPATAINL